MANGLTTKQESWTNRIVGHADVPPDQLLGNPRNYRRHPKPQQDALSGTIGQIGFLDPVIVQAGSDTVIDGHLRVELALRSNQPTIPVTYVDLTDEEAALALATIDPLSAMAYHDTEQLDALLAEVSTDDAAVQALLDSLATEPTITEGLTDPDDVPAVPSEPVTKPGDLWLLGTHRLLCGDATDPDAVRLLMDGQRSPLMPTDPPYLVNYRGGNHPQSWHNRAATRDKHWDDYAEGDGADFFARFLRVALDEALTPNPALYQFHASSRQALVEQAWRETGLLVHQQIIWAKSRAVLTHSHYLWQHEPCFYGWVQGKQPTRKPPANATTVWQVDQAGDSQGLHPTQKPVELIQRMVEYHTLPGEVVYEPFGGSGTALIACELTGRVCYALELAPAFCDVIVRRFENYSGQTATRAPALHETAAD